MNEPEHRSLLQILLTAGLAGMLMQLAVNLAHGAAGRRGVVLGLMILSGAISCAATLLIISAFHLPHHLAAAAGAMLGAAPPLMVLRAALDEAARRAGVPMLPSESLSEKRENDDSN